MPYGLLDGGVSLQKIEVLVIKQDDHKTLEYANTFNSAIGCWSIKYFGVPVTLKAYVIDWARVEGKMGKRVDGWQGGSPTLGCRKILIDTGLSSVHIYYRHNSFNAMSLNYNP